MSLFLHVTLVNWRDGEASPGDLTGPRGQRVKEGCETTQNKRAESPAQGIQLEVWLVEVSEGELRVSPDLTGRILSWGRGG